MSIWLIAVLMGLVEGATEFIPVSSTGHLVLADRILGFDSPTSKTFTVVIQFGAILAVCWIYRQRLLDAVAGIGREPKANLFFANLMAAFVPTAVAGLFAYRFIKEYLFSPWVVAVALIAGGLAILLIERNLPRTRAPTVDDMKIRTALGIGVIQCLSMVPGVSRSGATIMGALLLGVSRVAATEFSFFLAIPVMFAASTYDLWKTRHELGADSLAIIAVGFVTAFVSSVIVVKWLIRFVSRHDFTAFAWYRIIAGVVALAGLWAVG
jgi:undecaprenyl-diphosphatase